MIDRRQLLLGASALAASWTAHADDDDHHPRRARSAAPVLAAPTSPKARVVVVGGGMAGATVAKYLRMWGDQIAVTLVERAPSYTSCILSSLVLTGQRPLSSLVYGYDALRTRYGIATVFGEVVAIDPVAGRVTLAGGQTLVGDRVVVAPGIEFDPVPGLTDPLAMPHAWKAGAQTTELARQLRAMPPSGTFVLTVPPVPYRCPPGPYERATLVADWLRVNKPQARLLVLDANPAIVTEADNFSAAFRQLYPNIVQYVPNAPVTSVDTASKTVFTPMGAFRGDVVNLIPRQRAGAILASSGLVNDAAGRFAAVDVLSYASTAAPTKIHVIGDSSSTTQPKAGHVGNQEAKTCADAIARILAGGSPDPAPVTNSACFSTITMREASWLEAVFQYDPAARRMVAVPAASGASAGWNGDNFEDMQTWFRALMSDTFA